jgi:hypothetical protein
MNQRRKLFLINIKITLIRLYLLHIRKIKSTIHMIIRILDLHLQYQSKINQLC